MRLLRLLAQVSLLRLTIAIFLSVLSGVAAMGAIICVVESFRGRGVLWWQFAGVAALSVAIDRYSRVTLGRLALTSTVRLRRRLVRSVLHVPLLELERIGPTRLLLAYTSDLTSVSSAVRNLASIFASAAFLVALLGYIGWLSPTIMAVTATLSLVSIAGAVGLRALEQRHRRSGRDARDRVLQLYQLLLDGVKELKLNRHLARRVLAAFEERVREQRQTAGARARYSDLVGVWLQAMYYVILGAAIFGPFVTSSELSPGFGLLALLRIRRPLQTLVVDSGAFAEASIALQRILDLGLTLAKEERDPDRPATLPTRNWRSLQLQGLVFRYEEEAKEGGFALGPVDIALGPGEIVFVAGGNGSGKTTLVKLLTGLYEPTAGAIRLDGVPIDDQNMRLYRSKFAVVFADFCLFDEVADPRSEGLEGATRELAARLRLDAWAAGEPETEGAAPALSSGERRRLALLVALLDDRPILVFDEWAADQDPAYRDLFYREILPQLRQAGKLAVVVSHDERYFHLGDRVLWLERGEPPIWRPPASFDLGPGSQPVAVRRGRAAVRP
ncbi:MAG TPA: cyclic peptide export ABC transporter [Stellaceae bacterium]|nr:cyclic peptide export ABC transporter [Stellaceae bacterium]